MLSLRHILVALLLTTTFLTGQSDSKIEIRLVAERLPRDLGKVVLLSGEESSEPFELPMNNLSEPLEAPSRTFQLISPARKVSIANIALPKQGSSFVVLLIPAGEKTYYWDDVTFGDLIAFLFEPGDQNCFAHIKAQFGHDDIFSHYKISFTAAITRSLLINACCSKSAE